MTEGDAEFERLLVATFIEEMPKTVEAMVVAYAEGDLTSMGRHAHSMKPNIQLFGVEGLMEDVLLVEDAGKNEEASEGLSESVEKISNTLLQVVNELK